MMYVDSKNSLKTLKIPFFPPDSQKYTKKGKIPPVGNTAYIGL